MSISSDFLFFNTCQLCLLTFLSVDQSSPFWPNLGEVAVDHLLFWFSICRSVPAIFQIKVQSCPKSCQILDVFALPRFRGAGPKSCTQIVMPASWHVTRKVFYAVTPLGPKLLAHIRLILGQFLHFYCKKMLWPLSRWGMHL